MKRIPVAWLLVLAVAGCADAPPSRVFRIELPVPDHVPMPVELRDWTGLVLAVAAQSVELPPTAKPVVQADPTDPTAIVLRWLGGMCEQAATLSFRSAQDRYTLRLDVRSGSGCTAAGYARGVRIETSTPIDPNSVVVSGLGY